MPTRIRIRGPSGQSTATLEDTATLQHLHENIQKLTGLSTYDIKYSYPPKPLKLDGYDPTTQVSSLDIKLNGEQLLVSRSENAEQTSSPDESTKAQSTATTDAARSTQQTNKTIKTQDVKDSSAPLSLTRKQNKEMSDPPEVFVPDVGGTLVLRIMPDDNSCLFRAISSAVMSDIDAVTELRSIVAESIQADPETFNKAVLDNKDPETYCRWIRSQDSWGGQVELLILSQHFNVEICSIDVQTLRVDRYNEGSAQRCFLVYSGIHYDTIALSLPGTEPEDDVKVFEAPIKDEILPKAKELCQKLQDKHYYTDTAGFRLKCNICGALCIGEMGATKHAESTGHQNFGEAD